MSQCPYPESFTDQVSGKTESNLLYLAWHDGYEANKFEMASRLITIASLIQELKIEVSNVKELKRELEKQRAKLSETFLLRIPHIGLRGN